MSVRKSYGPVLAVDGIAIDVEEGSRTAIVGPSASGKSTLLRLIAGFEEPDRGEVMLAGDVLAGNGHMIPAHRRGIGYVPQDGALFPHLTVAQNVGFGLSRNDPERSSHIDRLLRLVGLDPSLGRRRPDQLSGGQQQRVAIARALAQKPRLMLLDESFSALDTNLRATTRKAITDVLTASNVTTILVTHDQTEALSFADHVAVLQEGRLVQFGTPQELYERPRTPWIASYLGDAILLSTNVSDGWADCELGRLPVNAAGYNGPAQILLRPEQIQLAEIAPADAGRGELSGCQARVLGVDFGGSVNLVTVRLSATDKTLIVKHSGLPLPPIGAQVRLMVSGSGHVFEAVGRPRV